MKYLIIILLFVTACSDDPEPVNCQQLKAETESAWKAWQANPGNTHLHDAWYQKQSVYFSNRCQ
jgi:hypothetical protein